MVIQPIEISGGWCWHGIGTWVLTGPNNDDFKLNGQIIRGEWGIATTGAIDLGLGRDSHETLGCSLRKNPHFNNGRFLLNPPRADLRVESGRMLRPPWAGQELPCQIG